ncbi:MAG: hypothetical protein LC100_06055 [Chitinophagales bacterium]|nr:hypothetical protein [Chitinophagales bacterium]
MRKRGKVVSSTNGNGKGNLLISYLFKKDNVLEQINEEAEIKVLIQHLLSSKGYKFVIADDALISEKLLKL